MGCGLWVMGYGLRVSSCGFWVAGFGNWIVFLFWALPVSFYVFDKFVDFSAQLIILFKKFS